MPISLKLKAEQKNLLSLFGLDDVFVIPTFQRPYSWGYEECDRLYSDLAEAFKDNSDYFLGTIVIASTDNEDVSPHIIDGQQRLITMYMIAKVLMSLRPEFKKFANLLYLYDDMGKIRSRKIVSQVLEYDDNSLIGEVMGYSEKEAKKRLTEVSYSDTINPLACHGRIEENYLRIFKWFLEFQIRGSEEEFKKYIEFFFRKVYMLPITLSGATIEEAESDALTIFETINDRGMSLQDADIIKALLYKKSKNLGIEDSFISSWKNLTSFCKDLNISIDDLFRYYYYIIKDKPLYLNESNSNKLRDYFVRSAKSPLILHDPDLIINDLKKILEILEYLENIVVGTDDTAMLMQIINVYTNQYPRYAIVSYLFNKGLYEVDKFDFKGFLKKLIRLSYGSGSTTSIKSEIFSIIRSITQEREIQDYYFSKDLDVLNSRRVFPLRKGLLMLYLSLETPSYTVGTKVLNVDRIIPKNQFQDNEIETIGNFFLTEGSVMRGAWGKKGIEYKNKLPGLFAAQYLSTDIDPLYLIKERTKNINDCLSEFFYKNEKN